LTKNIENKIEEGLKKLITYINSKSKSKSKRSSANSIRVHLDNLLKPLEPTLRTIFSKIVSTPSLRSKLIASLERPGSLAQILVSKPSDRAILIHELTNVHDNVVEGGSGVTSNSTLEKRWWPESASIRIWHILVDTVGLIAGTIIMVTVFPIYFIVDVLQYSVALVLLVSGFFCGKIPLKTCTRFVK
jgi:hypothetical protein